VKECIQGSSSLLDWTGRDRGTERRGFLLIAPVNIPNAEDAIADVETYVTGS